MSVFDTTVYTIRFLSADAVERATCGHPGTPMALAGITTEIFANHLRYQPQDPQWPNRDRFVLSCGHASMLLYSVLHLAGYALSKEDLQNFRQLGSKTPGHPEYGHTDGVETTTGPLGQGVGNAVGMALASKMMGARVGADLIDYRVFALASDGDLMEGVASEAASLAGHWGLDNLVLVYDQNNITIDGKAEESFTEDVGARFAAYGWNVTHVDGHDAAAVSKALTGATSAKDGKPQLIVAKTHIGIGLPTKQDSPKAHGSALGRDEINGAKQALGWPTEEFVVPEEARSLFKQRAESLIPEYQAWQAKVQALPGDKKAVYDAMLGAAQPEQLFAELIAQADTKEDATRSSGGKMLQEVAKRVPRLVSGSADLAASTKTDLAGTSFVKKGDYAGRNFHFGIREHGMGSIANGLALSGFFPVVSTFLIFSDYMRPTLRLASMMKQRLAYVFTHDSFFVGEDGPTHQPVEQVNSLRLIPGLDVWRPADSAECAAAWASALTRKDGPSALALTRQNLPPVQRPAGFDPKSMLKGAYVVSGNDKAELVLVATGSEVSVAVEAKAILEAKGLSVAVVSMPCVEAFMRLPAAERAAILGTGKRVAIEAGTTALWYSIVGLEGLVLGVDQFGICGPAEAVQKELGLTGEQVAARIETWNRG